VQTLVSGNQTTSALLGQRDIEAIVSRMVEREGDFQRAIL
jgi:hypothetical protein